MVFEFAHKKSKGDRMQLIFLKPEEIRKAVETVFPEKEMRICLGNTLVQEISDLPMSPWDLVKYIYFILLSKEESERLHVFLSQLCKDEPQYFDTVEKLLPIMIPSLQNSN